MLNIELMLNETCDIMLNVELGDLHTSSLKIQN